MVRGLAKKKVLLNRQIPFTHTQKSMQKQSDPVQ